MNEMISKHLAHLRVNKKITQVELGNKLGMSRSKISSWEIGRRDISVDDAVIICDYFGISLDSLLNPTGITSSKILDAFEKYAENEDIQYDEKKDTIEKIERILEKTYDNVFNVVMSDK